MLRPFTRNKIWGFYGAILFLSFSPIYGQSKAKSIELSLSPNDVIATGNEWLALPTIRASDGSLTNFNVLSMRDRGLLQVEGDHGTPALQPYFLLDGKPLFFQNPRWELIDYWIPVAHLAANGLEARLTYCTPPRSRGAIIDMQLTNRGAKPISISLGIKASWGSLSRITYTPVPLRGERAIVGAPWEAAAQVFTFITHDTHFAWSLYYLGSEGKVSSVPLSSSPALDAHRTFTLASGETAETHFVLGVGMEEYSASQSAFAIENEVDRNGVGGIIDQAAAWCRARTRTTGNDDLDVVMNRNFLFTSLYAWGRALDTEQIVGVTSRSPRYYVSAAYWDRDAMLWSFPALLDIDRNAAREALNYALTVQLRNAGTHSRFIDGIILEDGFELDEAAAPLFATSEYFKLTQDAKFLTQHEDALIQLYNRIVEHLDADTGLYWTLQDAQDQYYKQQFSTYDNVLVWRTLFELSGLFQQLGDSKRAEEIRQRAETLRPAILKNCVSADARGATGPIFVVATDGKKPLFADVPPGSLLKLPALGFIQESDPLFVRTYEWLHSRNYQYSYSDQAYGLPGSYRLPFSTSWSVADHLNLKMGREQGLKVLRGSGWDGGIISEGVNPTTAVMDYDGRAFATAAGYVAHAICRTFCQPPTEF